MWILILHVLIVNYVFQSFKISSHWVVRSFSGKTVWAFSRVFQVHIGQVITFWQMGKIVFLGLFQEVITLLLKSWPIKLLPRKGQSCFHKVHRTSHFFFLDSCLWLLRIYSVSSYWKEGRLLTEIRRKHPLRNKTKFHGSKNCFFRNKCMNHCNYQYNYKF